MSACRLKTLHGQVGWSFSGGGGGGGGGGDEPLMEKKGARIELYAFCFESVYYYGVCVTIMYAQLLFVHS